MTLLKRVKELRDNAIYPSREEENTIEHMDIGLNELNDLLTEIIIVLTLKD